ncbi:MAG: peptidoglycan-binding protein [Rhodospirillales bacterium]|nr:peptidoglycan-binding protein [Rhodospirillales bacterium]
MMWRSGVAVLLIVLLVVLVGDLWFRDTVVTDVADPQSTTAYRHNRNDASYAKAAPATHMVASVASVAMDRPRDAAVETYRLEAGSGHVADMVATRARSDVFGGDLDQLDLTRLPRAFADGDEDWRGAAADKSRAVQDVTAPSAAAVVDGKKVKPIAKPSLPSEEHVERTQPAIIPPPRPAQGSAGAIADTQRKLIALGYDIGAADGRLGHRTEAAVRDFEKTMQMDPRGRIDEPLQSRLDAEVMRRAQAQHDMDAMTPPPPPHPEPQQRRSVLASMMGGFQRLVGRDFDSSRRPDEIATYCRGNAETWIYDFGREAFVYCGNVIASGVGGYTSGKTTESAASR